MPNREEVENLYKLIYQCVNAGMTTTAERLQGELHKILRGGVYATQNGEKIQTNAQSRIQA